MERWRVRGRRWSLPALHARNLSLPLPFLSPPSSGESAQHGPELFDDHHLEDGEVGVHSCWASPDDFGEDANKRKAPLRLFATDEPLLRKHPRISGRGGGRENRREGRG